MRLAILAAALLVFGPGCGKKKDKSKVAEPVVIEEEGPGFGTVEDQKKAADEAAKGEAGAEDGKTADETPWGVRVANVSKKITVTLVNCNDKYLKALKPDELLVGKPALVTSDGIVTVMDDTCLPIVDTLKSAGLLFEGKHPQTDEVMRHWTLLADMYARVSRSAVNIGANAERRKLNHAELVKILPLLTDTTVPALRKALTPLMTWTEKDQPRTGVSAIRTLGKEEALKHWGDLMTATTTDISLLDSEWMTKGHDLVKGELFARMRYLNWLDGHWKRRLSTAKMGLSRLSTGDAAFDGDVKKTMDAYFAAVDAYIAGGWKVGMAAFEDKSLIDEPKLKAGVDGFKKSKKAFERSLKKIKLPKA